METKPNLLTLVCEKYKCPPEAFESTMLRRSVSPLAWPVVRLMVRHHREVYEFDLELIRELKNATSFAEASRIISSHCSMPQKRRAIKLLLLARVSKRRLKSIAREVFAVTTA